MLRTLPPSPHPPIPPTANRQPPTNLNNQAATGMWFCPRTATSTKYNLAQTYAISVGRTGGRAGRHRCPWRKPDQSLLGLEPHAPACRSHAPRLLFKHVPASLVWDRGSTPTIHLPVPPTTHYHLTVHHLQSTTCHRPTTTLHPSPFTLHPSPFTLHPSPVIRHPSPATRHPPGLNSTCCGQSHRAYPKYTELAMDEDDGELRWRKHQVSEGQSNHGVLPTLVPVSNYKRARPRFGSSACRLTVLHDHTPDSNLDFGHWRAIRTQAQTHPTYRTPCASVWTRATAEVKSEVCPTLRSRRNRRGLGPTRAPSTAHGVWPPGCARNEASSEFRVPSYNKQPASKLACAKYPS